MSDFPHKMLLAVDGSQTSRHACEIAVDVCRGRTVETHVLHVYATSQWTTPRMVRDAQIHRMLDEARAVLDAEMDHLRDLGLDEAKGHVRIGRPTDEILRLRDEIGADLIVLGSRGMNAFKRVLLGNDAESIVRHAPCPVLVVRRED